MGKLKTRTKVLLALALVGTVTLLWVRYPIAPQGQKLAGRTNAAPSAFVALVERQTKQRQKSQERKMAEQDLLQFALPLDTVSQRQEFYDKLLRQSPLNLYQTWEGSLGSDKEQHKGLLEMALSASLKQFADTPEARAVYAEAAKFLGDTSESESSKIRLVKWLGQSGTPEALALLLDNLRTATGELKFELLGQLDTVGNSRWNRVDSERLSTLLEVKWKEAVAAERPDVRLLGPLAQALASVGHPEGIKILLDEVARPGGPQDSRATVAFGSFKKIRNDAGIPVLAEALPNRAPDSPVLVAAGEGLAGIGSETATIPLIAWALGAGDEYAEVAGHLFSKLWHPVALKKARYVFIENNPFKSERVRSAVQGALARNGVSP